jgi:hypothetical protein
VIPMEIVDIIKIRDRLKSELEITEKFLEIARRQLQGNEAPNESKPSPPPAPSQRNLDHIIMATNGDYGSIGKTVVDAIKVCPIEFTVRNIFEAASELKRPLSKLQISTALARLSRQGKIETVTQKKGKSPAIYRRT